jgi:hypothetical protein
MSLVLKLKALRKFRKSLDWVAEMKQGHINKMLFYTQMTQLYINKGKTFSGENHVTCFVDNIITYNFSAFQNQFTISFVVDHKPLNIWNYYKKDRYGGVLT